MGASAVGRGLDSGHFGQQRAQAVLREVNPATEERADRKPHRGFLICASARRQWVRCERTIYAIGNPEFAKLKLYEGQNNLCDVLHLVSETNTHFVCCVKSVFHAGEQELRAHLEYCRQYVAARVSDFPISRYVCRYLRIQRSSYCNLWLHVWSGVGVRPGQCP